MAAILHAQTLTDASTDEVEIVIDLDKSWHEDVQWNNDTLHIEDDHDVHLDRAISQYLALDLVDDRARRWLLS